MPCKNPKAQWCRGVRALLWLWACGGLGALAPAGWAPAQGPWGGVAQAYAQMSEREHQWLAWSFAACEGVGVKGAARAWVQWRQQAAGGGGGGGGQQITFLQLHLRSAIALETTVTPSAQVEVRRAGQVLQTVRLQRPSHAALEPTPAADETRRLYLPVGQTLQVPAQAQLWLKASALAASDAGACVLGSTEQALPR